MQALVGGAHATLITKLPYLIHLRIQEGMQQQHACQTDAGAYAIHTRSQNPLESPGRLAHGLEVCDEVLPLVGLLDASEGHLGALDVLLGVLEVLEEDFVGPGDARLLIGARVGEAIHLARLASEEPGEVGACGVLGIRAGDSVALQALLLVYLGSLSSVTHYQLLFSPC